MGLQKKIFPPNTFSRLLSTHEVVFIDNFNVKSKIVKYLVWSRNPDLHHGLVRKGRQLDWKNEWAAYKEKLAGLIPSSVKQIVCLIINSSFIELTDSKHEKSLLAERE